MKTIITEIKGLPAAITTNKYSLTQTIVMTALLMAVIITGLSLVANHGLLNQ